MNPHPFRASAPIRTHYLHPLREIPPFSLELTDHWVHWVRMGAEWMFYKKT